MSLCTGTELVVPISSIVSLYWTGLVVVCTGGIMYGLGLDW